MTVTFVGTFGTLGRMLIGEAFGMTVPDGLIPEKHASSTTVILSEGILAKSPSGRFLSPMNQL
ncbi:hypothetical protein A6A05_11040 [Magnetospirillum moscoviense]|uniref:Uncharacterized protein n=1 Tax=Magnetospirillum moscoviense TaxID=1437059 RepID=A0A178MTB4_9PROT|nr:hypothetical protein A6A05_11040 [Magnetospirillum moscoviense]